MPISQLIALTLAFLSLLPAPEAWGAALCPSESSVMTPEAVACPCCAKRKSCACESDKPAKSLPATEARTQEIQVFMALPPRPQEGTPVASLPEGEQFLIPKSSALLSGRRIPSFILHCSQLL